MLADFPGTYTPRRTFPGETGAFKVSARWRGEFIVGQILFVVAVTRRTDAGVESQTGPGLNCSADAGGEAWSERLSGHKDMIDPSVPVL